MKSSVSVAWRGFGLFVVASAWAAPVLADDIDVEERLKLMQARRSQVKALHTVTETTMTKNELSRKSRFEYWEMKVGTTWKTRRAGRTETKTKEAKDAAVTESLTVSDGEYLWSELPDSDTRIVVKSAANRESDYDSLLASLRQGKVRVKTGEKVEGLDTVVVDIVSENKASPFKATYWISERHGIILKQLVRHANGGSLEMTTTLCEVDGTIPPDTFIFKVPEGAQVIDTTRIGKEIGAKPKP